MLSPERPPSRSLDSRFPGHRPVLRLPRRQEKDRSSPSWWRVWTLAAASPPPVDRRARHIENRTRRLPMERYLRDAVEEVLEMRRGL